MSYIYVKLAVGAVVRTIENCHLLLPLGGTVIVPFLHSVSALSLEQWFTNSLPMGIHTEQSTKEYSGQPKKKKKKPAKKKKTGTRKKKQAKKKSGTKKSQAKKKKI